jgi:UDP-glucose 4-epimerase
MRVAVTGGAGFIGSNLADLLETAGHEVVVIDNFSTGQRRFLLERPFTGKVIELDLTDGAEAVAGALTDVDAVFHLAANADVRWGWSHQRRDLEQNLLATLNVADAMVLAGVPRLLYSSTGSVYGETTVIPTPEACPIPVQTSLYGASKAAAEGFLGAYAEAGHLNITVFRFVSILGPRYMHGHVIDFYRQLMGDPDRLVILGDGRQRKSYLDISDCMAAMLARLPETPRFEVFNLGSPSYCTVDESVSWICQRLGLKPTLEHTGGRRGWLGDNPFVWLDTSCIQSIGWRAKIGIRQALERTVDYLVDHPWVLDVKDPR